MFNQPLVRAKREAQIDYVAIDPATRAPAVEPTDGWFSSSRRKSKGIAPRVESFAFSPYTQTRENLYAFQRDSLEPRIWYEQTRLDGKYMGSVEATATGYPREFVAKIMWHKKGGSDFEFTMVGPRTDLPPLVNGYVKQTDLGGKLRWIAVATKLRGKDILIEQGDTLFSAPLYEAIATGTAFGLFTSDTKIRLSFPLLGTQGAADDPLSAGMKAVGLVDRRASAPVGSVATNSMHGAGPERWLKTQATDANPMVKNEHSYRAVEPVEPYTAAVEVTNVNEGLPVGAVFPLHEGVDVAADGVTVQRMVVSEKVVTYSSYPDITGVKRYEVEVFSKLHEDGEEPVATLAVEPVVMKDADGHRALRYHVTKPLVGSEWVSPGREPIVVGEADVAFALSQQPGWDPRLHASIEAAMYKLPQGGDARVLVDVA